LKTSELAKLMAYESENGGGIDIKKRSVNQPGIGYGEELA